MQSSRWGFCWFYKAVKNVVLAMVLFVIPSKIKELFFSRFIKLKERLAWSCQGHVASTWRKDLGERVCELWPWQYLLLREMLF